ncbi:substrate-binding periplasmic protein [Neiella marina]
MKVMIASWLLLINCWSANAFADTSANAKWHLAAAHWCPYICDDEEYPGISVEYIGALLASANIDLEVTILPWTRAIRMAEKGKYDGLLTAVPEEAPSFLFTRYESGHYQMCFFAQAESQFSYNTILDLADTRLGVIQDYGYGEPLDSYIKANHNTANIVTLAHEASLQSLADMLRLSRIDLLVEDSNVVAFNLKESDQNNMNQVGCLTENPFYTAFSPAVEVSNQRRDLLDRLLQQPENSTLYQTILDKYRHR